MKRWQYTGCSRDSNRCSLRLLGQQQSQSQYHTHSFDGYSNGLSSSRTKFSRTNSQVHLMPVSTRIETHGEWIRQDWLDLADEMGLGTVIVPRCVGRTNDRQGGSEMHLAEHMVLQDQRLMWDIKRHPTVLAFALEGDTSPHWSNRSLWTDTLVDNPQGLPVFGKQLPVRLFQVEYNPDNSYQHQCRPENCASSWLVETVTQPKFLDWSSIAQILCRGTQQ